MMLFHIAHSPCELWIWLSQKVEYFIDCRPRWISGRRGGSGETRVKCSRHSRESVRRSSVCENADSAFGLRAPLTGNVPCGQLEFFFTSTLPLKSRSPVSLSAKNLKHDVEQGKKYTCLRLQTSWKRILYKWIQMIYLWGERLMHFIILQTEEVDSLHHLLWRIQALMCTASWSVL